MQKGKPTQVFGGICFVLFGCVFLGLGIRQLYLDWEFDGKVGRATSTIERLWISSSGKHGTDYDIRCRYEVGDGQFVESDSMIGRTTYGQIHVGEQIPIKFLLQDPSVSRIDSSIEQQRNWHNDEAVAVFALVFTAIGALIAWFGRPRKPISPS